MTPEIKRGVIKRIDNYDNGTSQIEIDRRPYLNIPAGQTRAVTLEESFCFYSRLSKEYLGKGIEIIELQKDNGTLIQRILGIDEDFMFKAKASRAWREAIKEGGRSMVERFTVPEPLSI